MTTQLLPHQLEWLRENSPSFRAAEAAVLRRDADCERNRQQFAPAQAEPVNIHSLVRRTSTYPPEAAEPVTLRRLK